MKSRVSSNQFHTCIQIEHPVYFHHTRKEGTLNSKERKELVKFLWSLDPDGMFTTNWDTLLYEWNKNNSRKRISIETEMPNYPLLR